MNDCLGVNNTRDESQNLCDVIYLDLYGQKAHIIGWLSMEKIVKFTSKFSRIITKNPSRNAKLRMPLTGHLICISTHN